MIQTVNTTFTRMLTGIVDSPEQPIDLDSTPRDVTQAITGQELRRDPPAARDAA